MFITVSVVSLAVLMLICAWSAIDIYLDARKETRE